MRILHTNLVLLIILLSILLAPFPAISEEETPQPSVSKVFSVYSEEASAAFKINQDAVRKMMEAGLKALFEKATSKEALLSVISTNDVIGIKVFSLANGISGTRTETVKALAECLLEAGVPKENIIVWDRKKENLILSGYKKMCGEVGIKMTTPLEEGWDLETYYESFFPASLTVGDVEFGKSGNDIGRKSYVSKLVSKKCTKFILVSPSMHHNTLGATGNVYSLASGATDNFLRFENAGNRLVEAAPEIYAMEAVGDKVVFCITDALICQYRGEKNSFLHYAKELKELRFSKDPVALDWFLLKDMMLLRKQSIAEFATVGKLLCENSVLLELGNISDSRIWFTVLDENGNFIRKPEDLPTVVPWTKDPDTVRHWWRLWL